MQDARLSLLACLSSNPGVLSVFTLPSLVHFLSAPRIRGTLTGVFSQASSCLGPPPYTSAWLIVCSSSHLCTHACFSVRLDLNSLLVQQLQVVPLCSSSVISLYRIYFFKHSASLPDWLTLCYSHKDVSYIRTEQGFLSVLFNDVSPGSNIAPASKYLLKNKKVSHVTPVLCDGSCLQFQQ